MSALTLVLVWLAIGCAINLWHSRNVDTFSLPLWLTAVEVLSWPLLIAPQVFPLKVTLEIYVEGEE